MVAGGMSETENQFQEGVIKFARLSGWLVYHPFDSRRSVSGFPDLTMVRERLVFAELKTAKGKASESQELWLAQLRLAGCEAHLWRPIDWPVIIETLRRQT